MKDSSLARPWIQMRKISSMYLSQIKGLSGKVQSNPASMAPMKMLAYVGAMHVPMAVPCTCRYVVSEKVKKLRDRMRCISLQRKDDDGLALPPRLQSSPACCYTLLVRYVRVKSADVHSTQQGVWWERTTVELCEESPCHPGCRRI
ncbi:hypothetical protein ElyMa_005128900 [Elysia marginata]|uniref:TGF-beta family profile domain-containing protein n=1 Tax=Elysia marginata TaxID=1093978 RepID=A0AAV4JP14_9GAST|nr:hypothetical protein ElyMa_005128900 [Elysia marginata]